MYQKIVMTGGISLFVYRNLFGQLTRDKELFRFEGTNPFPKDGGSAEEEMQTWLKEMGSSFFKIQGREKNISAEYSMLCSLKINNKVVERPEITLIHTDTFAGKAAAYLNKEILERDFKAEVKLDEIKDLDVTDRVKLNRSLGDFMSLINKHLHGGHKSYVCFAPIGGYKIFSSLGYIVASFNDLPTAYLHEDKQILHEIPPIPVKYDDIFIEKNIKFLRKLYISGILEQQDLEYHQFQLIKENSHFFEMADNMISINPFGLFICNQDKFRHVFGIRVFISQEAVQLTRKNPSAKSFILQQLLELTKKVESNESDAYLYHEREIDDLKGKTLKYHLYKGASNGIHVFRASWKYDEEKRELYTNYIWLSHNDYEREAPRGKGLEEDFGGFKEISKEVYQPKN
ncbi:MAG: putative CRISPR-associated protein [Tepidanaerobacteraceae bacterium]|jgi:putative CRISPR-associated protein (TIGR02619 family)